MPTPVTWSDNLHTVAVYRHPLGVVCAGCGHRGLIDPVRIDAHHGNMRRILDLKLVCAACGSRKFGAMLFGAAGEAERWRDEGATPPPGTPSAGPPPG